MLELKKEKSTKTAESKGKESKFFNYIKLYVSEKINSFQSIQVVDLETYILQEKNSLFLLGRKFSNSHNLLEKQLTVGKLREVLSFLRKFTYQSNFLFEGSCINDMGWGCTIRSGQMLLFNYFSFAQWEQTGRIPSGGELLSHFTENGCFSIGSLLLEAQNQFNIPA